MIVLLVMGFVLFGVASLVGRWASNNDADYVQCSERFRYSVNTEYTELLNVRAEPGRRTNNLPIAKVPQNIIVCYTGNYHIYTQDSGKKAPWLEIRPIADQPWLIMESQKLNLEVGWVNGCLLSGQKIGDGLDGLCQ